MQKRETSIRRLPRVGGSFAAPLVAAAALLSLAREARAETLRLSLHDAVTRALSDGTAARIADERVGRAEAQAGEARAALLPRVGVELEGANESLNLATFGFPPSSALGIGPVVGPFSLLDFHATAAMRVVDLAARRRWEAARQGTVVSEVERRRTENEVASAVASLYVALRRAGANVETARANVALFSRLRDLAVDQLKSGVATRLDSTRAEVALARQQQALLVAQNQSDAARLILLHAIGADQSLSVELIDPAAAADEPAPSVEESLARARAERPELESIAAQIRAEDLAISAEQGERLPTLSAQFQAGYNGNHISDLSWTRQIVGLISVPVFTGGLVGARVAEARSRRRELELQRVETDRQVEEDVRRAILAYDSARERTRVASENLALAEQELELSRDRFANGVTSSIEVDNAQASLVAAQGDRIAAAADQESARFDLWRATGRIRDLIGVSREEP